MIFVMIKKSISLFWYLATQFTYHVTNNGENTRKDHQFWEKGTPQSVVTDKHHILV